MANRSREINLFTESGPVVGDSINKRIREREQVIRGERRLREQSSPILEAVLDEIDFDDLGEILQTIVIHCGIDPEHTNILGRDHVFNAEGLVDDDKDDLGGYNSIRNEITLNYSHIKKYADESGTNRKLRILEGLCHELIHGASKTERSLFIGKTHRRILQVLLHRFSSVRHDYAVGLVEKERQGYKQEEVLPLFGKELKQKFFDLFDEGVTEKLAREMVFDYLRRKSEFVGKKAVVDYRMSLDKRDTIYAVAVKLVDALVDKLYEKTGVEKRVVWQGILHGKFSGQGFDEPETERLFNEAFGSEFLKSLSTARSAYDLERIIKQYL